MTRPEVLDAVMAQVELPTNAIDESAVEEGGEEVFIGLSDGVMLREPIPVEDIPQLRQDLKETLVILREEKLRRRRA